MEQSGNLHEDRNTLTVVTPEPNSSLTILKFSKSASLLFCNQCMTPAQTCVSVFFIVVSPVLNLQVKTQHLNSFQAALLCNVAVARISEISSRSYDITSTWLQLSFESLSKLITCCSYDQKMFVLVKPFLTFFLLILINSYLHPITSDDIMF